MAAFYGHPRRLKVAIYCTVLVGGEPEYVNCEGEQENEMMQVSLNV